MPEFFLSRLCVIPPVVTEVLVLFYAKAELFAWCGCILETPLVGLFEPSIWPEPAVACVYGVLFDGLPYFLFRSVGRPISSLPSSFWNELLIIKVGLYTFKCAAAAFGDPVCPIVLSMSA